MALKTSTFAATTVEFNKPFYLSFEHCGPWSCATTAGKPMYIWNQILIMQFRTSFDDPSAVLQLS